MDKLVQVEHVIEKETDQMHSVLWDQYIENRPKGLDMDVHGIFYNARVAVITTIKDFFYGQI
jgi:hypothetical protein